MSLLARHDYPTKRPLYPATEATDRIPRERTTMIRHHYQSSDRATGLHILSSAIVSGTAILMLTGTEGGASRLDARFPVE